MTLLELQEQKNQLAGEISELGGFDGDWTAEHEARWAEVNKAYDALIEKIDAQLANEEERKKRIARAAEVDSMLRKGGRTQLEREFPSPGQRDAEKLIAAAEVRGSEALAGWFRLQNGKMPTDEQRDAAREWGWALTPGEVLELKVPTFSATRGFGIVSSSAGINGLTKNFDEHLAELRTLGVTNPPAGEITGGHQTVPEGFMNELERAMLAFGGLRRVMRIIRTNSEGDIKWPTANDTNNEGEWIDEAQEVSNVDPAFDNVYLKAFKISSAMILISAELLDDNAVNLAAEIASMTGERIGRGIARRLATGTGTDQMEGVINCPQGVVATSNSTIDPDELIDLQHSVDLAYRDDASSVFAMNDSTVAIIRKIQSGAPNYYLWQPGLQLGQPDRILGKPYVTDNGMPAVGANNRSVVFGAMRKFILREHAAFRFYRLEERYREKDLTGFVSFQRVDSRLLDAGTGPIKHLVHPA